PRPVQITFNNLIRAGMSMSYSNDGGNTYLSFDLDDDNFNTFDPIGSPPENLDYNDAAGALSVPVERIRRYTTPIDAAGVGWMIAYTSTSPANGPSGADNYGRISFYNYFRPPGMPNTAWNSATPNQPVAPTIPDTTTNPLHGFESARNPNMYALTRPLTAQMYAAMPYDLNGGTAVPTFDALINANINSPYLNEADEMQLYQGSPYDAPFGPNDLEWLYRKQDSDGQYLQSRLSSLAPISFTNGVDDLRRRRLFALDAWETTNFVWAYDNPGNAFPGNNRFGAGAQPLPASFQALYNCATITSGSQPIQTNGQIIQTPPLAHRDRKIDLNYPLPLSNSPDEPVRQKWIDNAYEFLKYALPPGATDSPQELAQLSQYLINVIDFRDPDATCTHYRNPDLFLRPAPTGTLNQPATLMSKATTTMLSTDLPLDQYGMEYSPVTINEVLAYSFLRKYKDSTSSTGNSAGYPTNRFFVELVNTLTESAGAGASTSAGPSPYPNANSNPSSLVLNNWEIVVTSDDPINRPDPTTGQLLTFASGAYPATAPTGIYGPIPLASTTFTNSPTTLTSKDVTLVPLTSSGPPSVQASPSGLPILYYYVIGNPLLGAPTGHNPFENSPPTTPTSTSTAGTALMVQTLDPQYDLWNPNNSGTTGATNNKQPGVPVYAPLPTPASGTAKYYWLYLRRPANPFQPASPANPMIVVDCIRFPYIEGGGKPPATVDPTDDTKDSRLSPPFTNCIYSAQRVTPYQGGHAVALAGATTNGAQNDTTYGYSEQMATPTTTTGNNSGYFGNQPITNPIHHTLGAPNDPSRGQNWDYFPFHDRDFTSVAELMLVPGCPPGLFTKQFAENVPSATFNNNTSYNFSPATGTGTTGPALGGNNLSSPHTFPYLVDKFFYTAASVSQLAGGGPAWPFVNGPDSAGWYRMFEFFEVPSPAF
ncbi:MAG: hypothetical protein JO034_23805, partial [Singulisphaera sp.]|nr:hypothetical protein [Singulisphaera sp.]